MKYLVYYDTPANKAENRGYSPAAAAKIDYMCAVLNRLGVPVELISASVTGNRKGCGGKLVWLPEKTCLKLFPCMGIGKLTKRLLGRLLFQLQLFFYLLFHIRKGEPMLVYHSLGYAGMLRLLRKLKKFRLILEVEEVYGDVSGQEWDRRKEFRLFSVADAYVLPTQLLNETINPGKKPYVLSTEPIRQSRTGAAGCLRIRRFTVYMQVRWISVRAVRWLPLLPQNICRTVTIFTFWGLETGNRPIACGNRWIGLRKKANAALAMTEC